MSTEGGLMTRCRLRTAILVVLMILNAGCAIKVSQNAVAPEVLTNPSLANDSLAVSQKRDLVTIRFACPKQDQIEFERLAIEFQELNPNIHVEIVSVEDIISGNSRNFAQKLMSAADTSFFLVDLDAAGQGYLRDLAAFVEADKSFKSEDFFPGRLDAFQWQGATWALPSQTWMFSLYYDKSMFDAAGVAYPTLDWTSSDFLSASLQLTLREGEEVSQYGFVDNGWYARQVLVHALATQPGTEQTPLNDPGLADAVRWYTDLALRFHVMPEALGNQEALDRQQDLIANGQVAMWREMLIPSLDQYDFRTMREVGVSLFPGEDGPIAFGLMYGYMMSASTGHPQESWRWLRFLSHHGTQNAAPGWLPARRSLAEETGYWDQFDEEMVDIARYAAEHLYVATGESEKGRRLDQAIDAIFQGTSVEEALADAQAGWEDYQAQLTQATPPPIVVARHAASTADNPSVAFAPPGGADLTIYRGLAGDFNQTHSDMQVQIVDPAQAQQADCFADLRTVSDSASRADLLNLQPLLEADPAFSSAAFSPRLLNSLRDRGDLWGLPFQAQARVMFYNRDLFDAAGVAYPQPGWTLDDFLAAAVALTQGAGDEKQYGFLPLNGDASDLITFLALQGAYPWDERGQPRFDAPEVAAAVRWYTDLAMTHSVAPAFPSDLPDRDPQAQDVRNALIRDGKVAMWSDFDGVNRGSVWPREARIGMAPLPVGQAAVTQFLPQGLFIAADTPNAQACWRWIEFLSQQPSAMQGMPARFAVLESPAFAAQVPADVLSTYRSLADYDDLPVAPSPEAGAQLPYLFQAVADILDGARAETALAQAQGQATK